MAPGEAAGWVIENFPSDDPSYGVVFDIIPKISWRKSDQEKLAKYYLRGMPFANDRAYRALSRVMSIERFLRISEEFMPKDSEDIDLVLYYLIPVLSGIIKSDFDRALLENFVSKYSGESRRG
ncbi:hypothetical protein [Burkholderia ubonensis]|uniref:hypothetical protein n=1 Tax=Burkholderia ubonensis TaxID=101571 RepID=UPI0012F72AFE|nr:hypothetical protein [Burkholderia ubonensis]